MRPASGWSGLGFGGMALAVGLSNSPAACVAPLRHTVGWKYDIEHTAKLGQQEVWTPVLE